MTAHADVDTRKRIEPPEDLAFLQQPPSIQVTGSPFNASIERVERLKRLFLMLSGLHGVCLAAHGRNDLLQRACEAVVETGACQMACFNWMQPHAHHPQNGRIESDQRADDFPPKGLDPDPAPAQAIVETDPATRAAIRRNPSVCNDMPDDIVAGSMAEKFQAQGYRSWASFPVLLDEQLIGVMSLLHRSADAFSPDEVLLLRRWTHDLGAALAHRNVLGRRAHPTLEVELDGASSAAILQAQLETRLLDTARAEQQGLALVLIDLNRLSGIHDHFGRRKFQLVLAQAADRLRRCIPQAHQLARTDTDQLALVLDNPGTQTDLLHRIEQHVITPLNQPFEVDGTCLRIVAKAGVAIFPFHGQTAEALYDHAEAAVTRARTEEQDALIYHPEMSETDQRRLSLETHLVHALKQDEFTLHYQPKVDIETGEITGLEALVRWNHPQRGLLPPAEFVHFMEETGQIVELGTWVLRQAAMDRRRWTEQGLKAPRVAVNVSAAQLRSQDFVRTVADALSLDTSPHGIDIEITESILVEKFSANIDKLNALRAMGVGISIDDFGTGYSSLAYLARLPVQVLKIDRSFISAMPQGPDHLTLVASIIALAHALRLQVVAEGVETEEERAMLGWLQCDQIQGHLVSTAVSWDGVMEMLVERND